jgi:hypothetical protein
MDLDRQEFQRRTSMHCPDRAHQALLVALQGVYASPEAMEDPFDLGGQTVAQRMGKPLDRKTVVVLPRPCDVTYATV